ncbi:MAG: hypothetical protein ACOWWM_06435 [Desulfobacterales bacterium]
MAFTITVDEANALFFIRVFDRDTLEDQLQRIHQIYSHPAWRPGYRLLVDFRPVEEATQKPADCVWISEARDSYESVIGSAKIATVADNDSIYDVKWVAEMLCPGKSRATSRAFRKWEDALKWLDLPEDYDPPQGDEPMKGPS